jgi:PAS domain-containing protein
MKSKRESQPKSSRTTQLNVSGQLGGGVRILDFLPITTDLDSPSISDILPAELLKRLLDLSPDLVCTFTPDGACYAFNESWARYFPSSNSRSTLQQIIARIDLETQVTVAKSTQGFEIRFQNSSAARWQTDVDGDHRWITWRLKFDEQLGAIFLTGIDETDAKSKELEKKDSAKSLIPSMATLSLGFVRLALIGVSCVSTRAFAV